MTSARRRSPVLRSIPNSIFMSTRATSTVAQALSMISKTVTAVSPITFSSCLPIFLPPAVSSASTHSSYVQNGSCWASSLKNISNLTGANLYPSLTPGYLFRKEPVAIRRVTTSSGIISQLIPMKASSLCFFTKWVLMPQVLSSSKIADVVTVLNFALPAKSFFLVLSNAVILSFDFSSTWLPSGESGNS